jgi:hypothetical protein
MSIVIINKVKTDSLFQLINSLPEDCSRLIYKKVMGDCIKLIPQKTKEFCVKHKHIYEQQVDKAVYEIEAFESQQHRNKNMNNYDTQIKALNDGLNIAEIRRCQICILEHIVNDTYTRYYDEVIDLEETIEQIKIYNYIF